MKNTIITSTIPIHETKYLAATTLKAVERFFALPSTQEKYEAWLVEYRKRKRKER